MEGKGEEGGRGEEVRWEGVGGKEVYRDNGS